MQPTRHSSVSYSQTGRMHNLFPDLNEEPPRHGSFVSQSSIWHDSSMDEQIEIERLRKQIPRVVYPYISVSGIQNVTSDENCRFRAVALGLGLPKDEWPRIRSDLVRELEARQRQYTYVFGTIGYEKIYSTVEFAGRWMKMPDTGLVIASAYNKVVVNLSEEGCNMNFSLWSRPPQSDSHEIIVVARVDGNHYIRVALREGFPLPLTHLLWITYRSDIASGWKDKFVSRENEFREYYYRIMNRGSILHEDLTYAMLHEMVMKQFNLEAIYPLNLSAKVSSIDDNFYITDDHENHQENMFYNFFEPKYLENIRPSNTITNTSFDNNGLDLNIGTSHFHNNESNHQSESHFKKPECSFAFGDYHEYEDEKNEFDDVVDEKLLPNFQKWQKYMSFKPDIPETPLYKSKPMISKDYKKETDVKVGKNFDNKEALDLTIRLKALDEGYQFLNDRSAPERHAAIALAVQDEFPLSYHIVCCRHLMMNLSMEEIKQRLYSGEYAMLTQQKNFQGA
nr:hypothetical protein [Tanacetum cinerariifolium]